MTAPTPNPAPNAPAEPPSPHHLEQQRRANRDAAAKLGVHPYGQRTDGLLTIADARSSYSEKADQEYQAAGKSPPPGFADQRPRVKIAGRVTLLRDNGKLLWLQLRDHTGDLQVALSQKDADATSFAFAKTTDLGDLIIATGPLMKTRTGELTIWASAITPAAKCLLTPPEKHAGLADVELRYRRRYVDMWASPETTRVFERRSRIVSRVRRLLNERGYIEVETPMLQSLAGGAAARPFTTHMNALDIPLYLRIAPELYLKRLLVGGMPKVYEINRNFRNEGLDKQHNPEFTMLEAYCAYGDVETVMELTEAIIRDAALMLAMEARDATNKPAGDDTLDDSLVLPFGDLKIDYGPAFDRVAYADLFERVLGFTITDNDKILAECAKRHLKTAGADPIALVNHLFEDIAEPTLNPARPTFITDYPAALSPLTRPKADNPLLADRADLFIGGMEIAPHYTELNDPDVQAAKFREQLGGTNAEKAAEEQTFRTYDADFIDALKVGMPPAGGMGLGIDRLVMLLTNQRTIRDVVLFPLMKPEQ